jgi:hypothetical protein
MRRRHAIALLAVVAALALLAWWLGPRELAWSARAFWRSRHARPAWHHVAPGAPIVLACDVRRFMAAPVIAQVRPRLDLLARTIGLDLGQLVAQVTHVVAVPEYVVGTGVTLSPALLPRVNGRWRREAVQVAGGASALAVTDGEGVLVPLEPGAVLWRLSAAAVTLPAPAPAETAPALALTPEVPLAGRVTPDDDLRRELLARLPGQGDMVVAEIEAAEIRLRPEDTLGVELAVLLRDEVTAAHLEGLVRQADATARLVRAAGPLAALVGGAQAAMLADVPPLTVVREGLRVVVTGDLDAASLDRWLARAARQLGG